MQRTYETASFVTARRVDGVEFTARRVDGVEFTARRVDGVGGHAVAATQRRRGGGCVDAVELRERAREFRII